MSYSGYRVIINGTTVPDNLIAKGSWNMSKPKRIVSNWKDANQIEHEDVLPTRKVDIKFSIKLVQNHPKFLFRFLLNTSSDLRVQSKILEA